MFSHTLLLSIKNLGIELNLHIYCRAEAEIHAYKTQVEIISYIESTVLGDPFNFLANWPSFVWLRQIPTCSIVGGGRLYRVPQLRSLFHKITRAKSIMLFQGTHQDHPNGYR